MIEVDKTKPFQSILLNMTIVKTPTQPQLNLTSTKLLGLTRLLLFTPIYAVEPPIYAVEPPQEL